MLNLAGRRSGAFSPMFSLCSIIVRRYRMASTGGDMTDMQMVLALIALTPEYGEGLRLPLPVALARLDRIAREVRGGEVPSSVAMLCP